jgi:hypothetical protein
MQMEDRAGLVEVLVVITLHQLLVVEFQVKEMSVEMEILLVRVAVVVAVQALLD